MSDDGGSDRRDDRTQDPGEGRVREHRASDDQESLTLGDALKLSGMAQTGGHAKGLIQGGLVKVNGRVEPRRKSRVRAGDEIEVAGERFVVEALEDPDSRGN